MMYVIYTCVVQFSHGALALSKAIADPLLIPSILRDRKRKLKSIKVEGKKKDIKEKKIRYKKKKTRKKLKEKHTALAVNM